MTWILILTHGYVFAMGATSVILYEQWDAKTLPMWKINLQSVLWPFPWGALFYELIKEGRARKRSV